MAGDRELRTGARLEGRVHLDLVRRDRRLPAARTSPCPGSILTRRPARCGWARRRAASPASTCRDRRPAAATTRWRRSPIPTRGTPDADGAVTFGGIPTEAEVDLRIYTVAGEIVYEQENLRGAKTWDGNNVGGFVVEGGVYLVRAIATDGAVYETKIAVQLMSDFKILDGHIHWGQWTPEREGWPGATLAQIREALRLSGIHGAALLPTDTRDNAGLAAVIAEDPEDLYLFAWVSPHHTDATMDFLESHEAEVAGIKIHPSLERMKVTDEGWAPFLRWADERCKPVIIHSGRWQEMASWRFCLDVAERYPQASIITAHLGGDLPTLQQDCSEEMRVRALPQRLPGNGVHPRVLLAEDRAGPAGPGAHPLRLGLPARLAVGVPRRAGRRASHRAGAGDGAGRKPPAPDRAGPRGTGRRVRILHICDQNWTGSANAFVAAHRRHGHESRLVTLVECVNEFDEDICLHLPFLQGTDLHLVDEVRGEAAARRPSHARAGRLRRGARVEPALAGRGGAVPLPRGRALEAADRAGDPGASPGRVRLLPPGERRLVLPGWTVPAGDEGAGSARRGVLPGHRPARPRRDSGGARAVRPEPHVRVGSPGSGSDADVFLPPLRRVRVRLSARGRRSAARGTRAAQSGVQGDGSPAGRRGARPRTRRGLRLRPDRGGHATRRWWLASGARTSWWIRSGTTGRRGTG